MVLMAMALVSCGDDGGTGGGGDASRDAQPMGDATASDTGADGADATAGDSSPVGDTGTMGDADATPIVTGCAMGDPCPQETTCCQGVPYAAEGECHPECTMRSDRRAKAEVTPVDVERVLDQLARLPLSTWRYREGPDRSQHLGPMAQDFREVFGLGDDDRSIHVVDGQGVTLAAIQALLARVEALEAQCGSTQRAHAARAPQAGR
jgi:hypothetical protein